MKKLSILLTLIGIAQLVLGISLLLIPQPFAAWMGLSPTGADINYLFGMLAARFIAYGIGMFFIAREPARHPFWINNMILIQAVDLAVGLFYTLNGTLTLKVSAFPMFNAAIFTLLLLLWRPKGQEGKA
jgi:hypothetical protein